MIVPIVSQISRLSYLFTRLSYFNLLYSTDILMHHQLPASFFAMAILGVH